MQCKDIPDRPILEFLARWRGEPCNRYGVRFDSGNPNPSSVRHAMPEGTPDKLVLAKMRQLERRGLVDGCTCGCGGSFELTDNGAAVLGLGPGRFGPTRVVIGGRVEGDVGRVGDRWYASFVRPNPHVSAGVQSDWLGLFPTKEAAEEAVRAAREKTGGETEASR